MKQTETDIFEGKIKALIPSNLEFFLVKTADDIASCYRAAKRIKKCRISIRARIDGEGWNVYRTN